MAIEDFEYVSRKTGAAVMIIFGVLVLIFFPIFGIASGPNYGSFFVFFIMGLIIGIALIVYGSYIWKKVTHIVWTKQAIREMMDKDYIAEQDFSQRYKNTSEAINTFEAKNCPGCGNISSIDDSFCMECGLEFGQNEKCPSCGTILGGSGAFCTECGTKILKEPEKNICSNCNYESENNYKFCPECGNSFYRGNK